VLHDGTVTHQALRCGVEWVHTMLQEGDNGMVRELLASTA
jgi:hypothetical protein